MKLFCLMLITSFNLASPFLYPLNLKSSPRLKMTDDNKDKENNIDLFAAANRKPPITTATTRPSSLTTAPPTSAPSGTKLSDMSTTQLAELKSAGNMELQAELLRLEAESEQLKIDNLNLLDELETLKEIDELIIKLAQGEDRGDSLDKLVQQNKRLVRKELFIRLAELVNSGSNQIERDKYKTVSDSLLNYLQENDSKLYLEITEGIKNLVDKEMNVLSPIVQSDNKVLKIFDQVQQKWIDLNDESENTTMVSGTLNGNLTVFPTVDASGKTIVRFPAALPVNMLPLILNAPEISTLDFNILKETVFTPDVLTGTLVDYSTFLGTFRGKPTVSLEETYRVVMNRINLVPGLNDRIRVFLLPEPVFPELGRSNKFKSDQANRTMVEKYSGASYEPVFTILSKQAIVRQPKTPENLFSLFTLLVTLFTTFLYSVDTFSLNPDFTAKAIAGDETVLNQLAPVFFGTLALQLVHELGHFIAGQFHQIKLGLPIFVPSLQIGLFGSVTRFLSFPKSRKAYFDVSIAGPFFGYLASVICVVSGLYYTQHATPVELINYPALPAGFFDMSIFLHQIMEQLPRLMSSTTSPSGEVVTSAVGQGKSALVSLHPLVVVGITGLITNSLNFLPIGRLDGGRVAMSIAGRRSTNSISLAALIGQAFSFLGNSSPLALFWGLTVILFQRSFDIPPEDDITPIVSSSEENDKGLPYYLRGFILAFCIIMTAGMILPVPIDPAILANKGDFGGLFNGAATSGGTTGLLQGLQSLPTMSQDKLPPPTI